MWLAFLAVILAIRFPVKFWLEPPFLMDFELFRGIALRILEGNAASLYTPVHTELALFKYAPAWAIVWMPFGWLSSRAGAVLWSGLNVAWLILTLWCAMRLCRRCGLRAPGWLSAATGLLLARILSAEFLNGQTDLLWVALTTGGLLLAATGRGWTAALAFALAISLKLPAGLFLLYFACQRQWALVGRTLACLAGFNLLGAWLLVPRDPLRLFVEWIAVLQASGPERAFEIGSQSLLALVSRFASQDGYGLSLFTLSRPGVLALTTVTALCIFSLIACHRPATAGSLRWVLDGACLTVCMALFSPTCWLATYSVLLFPLFILLAAAATPAPAPATRLAVRSGLAAVAALSLFTHRKAWRWIGVARIGTESYTYLVAMIPAWLALAVMAGLWMRASARSAGPHHPPAPP